MTLIVKSCPVLRLVTLSTTAVEGLIGQTPPTLGG